jgi:hypothetical protein
MVQYASPINVSLNKVASLGDGSSINISWWQAYPDGYTNSIAYHIYYSTSRETIFSDGVKYISIDGSLEANIINLIPGQDYFFSVRPVEYNPAVYNLTALPTANDGLKIYPTSILREDISATDLLIPLLDTSDFPSTGIIKIGAELIQYLAVDNTNQNLVLTNISQRGYNLTPDTLHTTSGYDGYYTWNPEVVIFTLGEDRRWDRIYSCQSRFEYPNFAATVQDGYRQTTVDLLSMDMSASDAINEDFPTYDYSGYHRTDPVLLLNGTCVGSYIGGEQGCIDGYGNYNRYRGFNLQDANTQRQDVLLSVTGVPACLIRRQQTGIICSCYLSSSEYQDDRCVFCNGTKFVFGYQQFFNPRRADGRILVRLGPTDENLKMYEAGLESEFPIDMWTLTVPTIKTRDILVLFDQNDNESFRYEVQQVTRNDTVLTNVGAQKMRVARVRKFDPAYQIKVFRDTANFPQTIQTTLSSVPGLIPPHTHSIQRNESDPSQWGQTTQISQGHTHPVYWDANLGQLVVMDAVNHTHKIIV